MLVLMPMLYSAILLHIVYIQSSAHSSANSCAHSSAVLYNAILYSAHSSAHAAFLVLILVLIIFNDTSSRIGHGVRKLIET